MAEDQRKHAVLWALRRAKANAAARGYRPGMGKRKSALKTAEILEEQTTGPGRDARDPAPVADTLARLFADHGWTQDITRGGVIGRWREIVGDAVADHCHPEYLDAGVLTLRAESSSWTAELKWQSASIIRNIDREVGEGVVTELKILGPVGPSWKKGRLRVEGPGPRDTYG